MATVRPDLRGYSEILKRVMQEPIRELSEQVADNARRQGHRTSSGADLPIDSKVVTTDRAHGIVAITHPAGVGMQAKHGVLTKAATEAGLEVTEK